MATSALLIFVRNPELGKVKAKIAQSLGTENALKIYQKLLEHTHTISKELPVDKYVFYSSYIEEDDLWDRDDFQKELQSGPDIGSRLKNAIELIFQKGYRHIVVIGSDCYELSEEIILTAFKELDQHDVVIGPATDGSYYLLGMNMLVPRVFEGKLWNSNQVYLQTTEDIRSLGYSLCEVSMLSDVDDVKDITFL